MTEFLLNNIWFVPFYGLIGAIFTLPWSLGLIKRTGQRPAAYLNLLFTFLGLLHGFAAFQINGDAPPQKFVVTWLQVAGLELNLSMEISVINLAAMGLVTGLTFLAQVYALGYMEKDWSWARFFGLMGFFDAALCGICLSDSLLLSYCLLEMLTLSTYLLVGFWYAQPLVVTAARDAFLTKRVGDILLLMGVVALSSYGEGLTFSDLTTWAEHQTLPTAIANLIALALIAGPIGKCAQFPLNLWLDEAMEGPNPAGILRNSIVVSAGAFILIKLQPIFLISDVAADALIIIGTISALGSSLVAIAQTDIKRTLSHATSASMGLVFIAVGLQQIDVALLLLLTHGLAKALLFMSIGGVILNTNNQNITEMGGLWRKMPATTIAFLVGTGGLLALFPLGTFWTLRRWLNNFWQTPWWLLAIMVGVNLLAAVNLTRVFRLVFLGPPQPKTRRAVEVNWPMALPMVSLTVMTLGLPLMLEHWHFLLTWTGPWLNQNQTLAKMDLGIVVISGVLGVAIGGFWPLQRLVTRPTSLPLRFLQDLLADDFYIGRLYDLTVVWGVRQLSRFMAWFDRYVVDGVVNFTGLATMFSGSALKYSVSGQSQFYVFTILSALAIALIWLIYSGQWPLVAGFWSSLLSP